MNRIKFSEIREKNESKKENYDKNKVESTLHNDEILALITDHKVEIVANDLPSSTETSSSQQQQQPNGTISSQ